ncbi:MAG: helix-turn-helix domain-containing protein [Bacteroidales bacterium]|jgi:hypothetical protein|nr:helix-turn-helix domain-containing protein [Bacteroidales bacterium]
MMITPDTNNQIFQLAADFVNQTSQHIFLTGKAGTGKTTFLKHIRHATHKNCIVAAPTGVAAINAGGVTLHSLFQLPFEPFVPGMEYRNSRERFTMTAQKRDMLRRLELLIIDEVSMLRADTLDSADAVLRSIRRSDKPFGGVQMLYIGDLFQLPPVVKEDEWQILKDYYASPFFFHAKAVERARPVYLELKKVYRQREQAFVDLLNHVRNDELTREDLDLLNRRYSPSFKAPAGEKYITLTTHNSKADAINNRELSRLNAPVYSFEGVIEGEFPGYALPTEMTLTLKEGAQIMFIKNDSGEEKRYYNGKIGMIAGISGDRIMVRPDGSQEAIAVEQETWKNVRYTLNKDTGALEEEELGSFSQYPIRLAWAITIHKSQGLTFERAIIDAGGAFAPGQAYVALSRCTSLEGIVLLSPIASGSVWTNPQAVTLARAEKEPSELQSILETEKRHFWANRLLLYFDCEELIRIAYSLKKLLEDKVSEDFNPARVLAKKLLQQATEMRTVAEKFQKQLQTIVQEQNGDIALLGERCRKGVEYFHRTVVERMLAPLQEYITLFNVKKAKTFYRQICALEADMKLFITNMKKVRYNDVALAEDMDLPLPRIRSVYAESAPEKNGGRTASAKAGRAAWEQKQRQPSSTKHPETSKIPTRQQSFNLFREGLSIGEIAAKRGISETTVTDHLSDFVLNGELSVFRLLPSETVEHLTPWIKAALAEDTPRLAPVREAVGEKYSYSDLRLVMSHCLYEQNRQQGTVGE